MIKKLFQKKVIASFALTITAFSCFHVNFSPAYAGNDATFDVNHDLNQDTSLKAHITNTDTAYSPISIDWFEQFQDKQLNGYIQRLLENNADLKNAEIQIKSSQLSEKYLKLSRWFPFQGSLSTQRQQYSNDSFQNGRPVRRQRFVFQPGLEGNLALDYMNKAKNQTQSAEMAIATDKLERDALTVDLVSQLAEAYFGISKDDRMLAVQDRLIQNKNQQLTISKNLFELNLATPDDIAKLNEELDAYQSTRSTIAQDRETKVSKLLALISYRPDQGTIDEASFPEVDSLRIYHPQEIPAEEILKRQDVLLKYFALKDAKNDINLQWKSAFPNISLAGQLGQRSFSAGNLFNANRFYYSMGLNLLDPLTHLPEARYRLKQSKFNYEGAVEDFKSTILNAYGEVHNLLYTIEKIDGAELAAETAKENRLKSLSEIYNADYEKGLRPKIDLLKADESVLKAQGSRLDKQFTYLQHCLQLYKSTGGHLAAGTP